MDNRPIAVRRPKRARRRSSKLASYSHMGDDDLYDPYIDHDDDIVHGLLGGDHIDGSSSSSSDSSDVDSGDETSDHFGRSGLSNKSPMQRKSTGNRGRGRGRGRSRGGRGRNFRGGGRGERAVGNMQSSALAASGGAFSATRARVRASNSQNPAATAAAAVVATVMEAERQQRGLLSLGTLASALSFRQQQGDRAHGGVNAATTCSALPSLQTSPAATHNQSSRLQSQAHLSPQQQRVMQLDYQHQQALRRQRQLQQQANATTSSYFA